MTLFAGTIKRFARRSLNTWLWTLAAAIALFTVTAILANGLLPGSRGVNSHTMVRGDLGHDFLAFYAAGRMVDTGSTADLYDLDALQRLQHDIAAAAGLTNVAPPVAPWWNPPHVAFLFAPLALLGFNAALLTWSLIGIACLALSAWVMTSFVRDVPGVRRREWLLVPALLLAAPPTLQALGHGQNTFLSLLLLSLTVAAWRSRMPLLAGLGGSLLFYKPQLAAIVALAMFGTLGWRVMVGLLMGLVPQALAALTLLPGTLASFITNVPANLVHIQTEQPYLWHRHATLGAFWRFALQGNGIGATHVWITILSVLSVGAIGTLLALCGWRTRVAVARDDDALDRFIATTVLATPLLMPFFFDYDLLLLTVGATLIGRDALRGANASRGLTWLGMATLAWTMFNPPLAELAGLNLTVPLLVGSFIWQARRTMAASVMHVVVDAPVGMTSDAVVIEQRRAA